MANIKKTPLTDKQAYRLFAQLIEINGLELKQAFLCEIEGTVFKTLEAEMSDGSKTTFYPDDDTLDLILNGIKLERGTH